MRGATAQMERPVVMRAGDIADASVRNPRGEEIGTIKDVVIDLYDGCIAYAALAVGGFMGLGENLYAIPWAAFKYNASDNVFILDISKERLENAPSFKDESWPAATDRDWLIGMYTHFGYKVPWERSIER
jgi:sporulation protein YlmC with PRC-barrel domain